MSDTAFSMTETLPASSPAGILQADTFAAHVSRNQPGSWLESLKQSGWERFNALPMPTRKDESWRFASILGLDLSGYHLPTGPDDAAIRDACERSNALEQTSGRMVFVDNTLVAWDPIVDEFAAQGVIFEPLEDAVEKHRDLLEQYLLKESFRLGSEKFASLHQAYLGAGFFLYLPRGVRIENPLTIYNWHSTPNAAVFPHSLVVAEDNAAVDVVDFYGSLDSDAPGLASAVGDIYASPGARVFRKQVQNWSRAMKSFQAEAMVAGRDSDVKSVSLNLGGRYARSENQIRITEPGANVRLYGLTVAEDEQEFDQRTLQIHQGPNAVSDLLYKNALLDKAHSIFSGLIKVEPYAQQTDAYQTNRNLLLDPTAHADSLPGLEIEANDVKCSHGATTGQLDPSEMFYFLSRGISREVAYELMVFGFFEEVIEKIHYEELRNTLRDLVQAKFRSQRGSK